MVLTIRLKKCVFKNVFFILNSEWGSICSQSCREGRRFALFNRLEELKLQGSTVRTNLHTHLTILNNNTLPRESGIKYVESIILRAIHFQGKVIRLVTELLRYLIKSKNCLSISVRRDTLHNISNMRKQNIFFFY